jgi:3-methyladenine DNA glycosylase AlkD
LKHKQETNTALLKECITTTMHEDEFFIRKSIGWVLREYSKNGGKKWVKEFVNEHKDKLSTLSKKEALKYV